MLRHIYQEELCRVGVGVESGRGDMIFTPDDVDGDWKRILRYGRMPWSLVFLNSCEKGKYDSHVESNMVENDWIHQVQRGS